MEDVHYVVSDLVPGPSAYHAECCDCPQTWSGVACRAIRSHVEETGHTVTELIAYTRVYRPVRYTVGLDGVTSA